MDTEYQNILKKNLAQFSQQPESYHNQIRQIVCSPHCYSWQIMESILNESSEHIRLEILKYIEKLVLHIKSFPMLVYLYGLGQEYGEFGAHIYWKARYIELALDGGEIVLFSTWVSLEPKAEIVQETLWLVINTFPSLFKTQYIEMTEVQLNSVLEWVTYFQSNTVDTFSGICEIVKIAKQTRLHIREDYIRKEHLILKKLIEVAGQASEASSNIFLFIYPFTLQQKDISYFCHIYCDFITDLAQENIVNFFKAITKSAISKQLVFLISKMSQLLKNQEEYFKLRIIYQQFILPYFTRRAKCCGKVEEQVYETCSFYILGLLKHCDLGEEGVKCMLQNIEKIKSRTMKDRWVQLCGIICHRYPQFRELILDSLKEKGIKGIELNNQICRSYVENEQIVWNVSLRNGRKHKKYPKVASKLRGIENKNNECYIISTVQALQKTALLPSLLDRFKASIKGKLQLLDELRILFGEVSGRRKADVIKVSYLKRKGPQYFTESFQQQDVQHYILELFSSIQNECEKVPGLLKEFKNIFEISTEDEIICQNCKQSFVKQQKQYIYTIPHTQILQQRYEDEELSDYSCQKCKKNQCRLNRSLKPVSEILIVHINRFSHENGKTYKELSTQMIHRKFMNYELCGMICHIGKNVEHGHYIYYAKIGERRWAQFNDRYTEEFEVQDANQQFEREMKAQMTPYILLYRKID